MNVYEDIRSFTPPPQGTVLTIGNFDGVHRGHQRILQTARRAADGHPGAVVLAMTFEPHPREILTPHQAPPRLTTRDEKLALLARHGVDAVIVLRSEPALFARSAAEFVAGCIVPCRPVAVVEGPTFSFGRGREGSIEMLRQVSARHGFRLILVDTWVCGELPGRPAVSSSAVRDAVVRGQVEDARCMLGRPYRISGTVVAGAGRGAPLGYPTANLDGIPQLLPGRAVYACGAVLPDGSRRLAAVNVGTQPTFDGQTVRVEAHLPDFAGELRGQRVALHFFRRLRGQIRFESAAMLRRQLAADVEATRACEGELGAIDE